MSRKALISEIDRFPNCETFILKVRRVKDLKSLNIRFQTSSDVFREKIFVYSFRIDCTYDYASLF